MRYLSRAAFALLTLLVVVLGSETPAGAAETVSSDTVIIRESVVIDDDLYATGVRVLIQGEVRGDLIVLAGEDLVIEGTVRGSVTAIAQEVVVAGDVRGSVRVVAPETHVSGTIGKDLVVSGVRLDVTDTGEIAGDALVWAWNASLSGEISGDLGGTQRNLDLSGEIGGDVDVSVTTLDIVSDLTVGGDLTYRSENQADGLELANIGGVIVQERPLPPNIRARALVLFAKILSAIFVAAMATLVALVWPEAVERAGSRLRKSPVRSVLAGLAVLVSPILLLILGLLLLQVTPASASLPLLAILVPLALGLLTLVLLLAVVASAPALLFVGRLVRSTLSLYQAIALGSAVVGLIWLLPWVGWVVPALVLPAGVGSVFWSGVSNSARADSDMG